MKNYDDANLEDLLTNKSFCDWISEQASNADKAFWENWLSENPERTALVAQAKAVLLALKNSVSDLSKAELQTETARILRTVQHQSKSIRLIPNWLKVAASILLLITIGFWIFNKKTGATQSSIAVNAQPEMITIQKLAADTMIQFSDSSTVALKKGSSLQFDKNFIGQQRRVDLLEGEDFFAVTKNAEKSFVVYANKLVVKVVGTSFTVRTAVETSVAVRTGKVAVFKKADFEEATDTASNFTLLTPNQQVSSKKNNVALKVTLVAMPILLEKPVNNPGFEFEDAPIGIILQALEKAYGIEIKANEAILKSCRLTISLGQDNLYQKLEVVCKVLGVKYEVVGKRIIISGKGC